MQEIKDLIATLSQSKANASQLITLFAKRIRTIHGECGVALLSTTKLKRKQCQITVYVNEQGKLIFDHNSDDSNQYLATEDIPIFSGQSVLDIIDYHIN